MKSTQANNINSENSILFIDNDNWKSYLNKDNVCVRQNNDNIDIVDNNKSNNINNNHIGDIDSYIENNVQVVKRKINDNNNHFHLVQDNNSTIYNIIDTKLQTNFNKINNAKRFVLNIDFGKRLKYLELKAIEIQYQLACLSTLGGAYHLCNHPQTALMIAYKQELIGIKLCSSTIILRAKVFQATNYYLMGYKNKSNMLFTECRNMIKNKYCSDDLLIFIEASEIWLHARDGSQESLTNINEFLLLENS